MTGQLLRFITVLVIFCLNLTFSSLRSKGEDRVVFFRDVLPILQKSCFECHGPKSQKGGLRLDQIQALRKSGVIVAGEPEESELWVRIVLDANDDLVMPATGKPLSSKEIAVIQKWIDQGAELPAELTLPKHWAYKKPVKAQLPNVSNPGWIKSPIDTFVMNRLDSEEMIPSKRASDEKRIRRLYLSLIGLPPDVAEVRRFVEQPTQEHYEQIVDELLSRQQFGEKWARPWLDLARYADSHGFQRDDLRDLWAYRDWVIQALNADMPFDQFTIEQIAGDLLPNATERQRIATGFHRCSPTNCEAGSLPEETRTEQLIDRVNTTAAVWLGTTMECSQCHDHKYDPFSARNYYEMLAFFNNTELEADLTDPKVPSSIQFRGPYLNLTDPDRDAKRAELNQSLQKELGDKEKLKQELETSLNSWALVQRDMKLKKPSEHPLPVLRFESLGKSDRHQILNDSSVLLIGDNPPDKDSYLFYSQAELSNVRAIRLEVLRHEKLPGQGPGRGDSQKTNFVLNDFSMSIVKGPDKSSSPVRDSSISEFSSDKDKERFVRAFASFSQKNWDVSGAIDRDPKSGWAIAPQFDRPHAATFVLDSPKNLSSDDRLIFRLDQSFGQSRTIGRFRLVAITGDPESQDLPKEIVNVIERKPESWTAVERQKILDYRLKTDAEMSRKNQEIVTIQKQIDAVKPDTTLVMVELDKPRLTFVFERGDYRKPGQRVKPGTPEVLHPLPDGPANRLTLARWLIDKENPLVARVAVNRWWAELFGQGLVTTPEDFGIKGDRPTHPELLDWLAVEYMENGWSLKKLLKTIVMSATFQQSSNLTPELLEKDDRNQLLARGPRYRMSAEMIRDNALAVSGLISLKAFGPPIRPYQPEGLWTKVGGERYDYQVSPGTEKYRRGIYVIMKRGSPYPSFMNFDASSRFNCTVKRSRTNTPLQALTILNDPVYVEAAESLADRMAHPQNGKSVESRISYGFQLCTSRVPNPSELQSLKRLYEKQKSRHGNNEHEVWISLATVLLNLHETVTVD